MSPHIISAGNPSLAFANGEQMNRNPENILPRGWKSGLWHLRGEPRSAAHKAALLPRPGILASTRQGADPQVTDVLSDLLNLVVDVLIALL
jgi:hypothetical protein